MQPETETPITPETPKPKRKYMRRHKRPNMAAPVRKIAAEFPGLTPKDCCDTCNVDGCVISGIPVCAHPFKGGLPPTLLGNTKAVARFNRAKRMLGKAKLDVLGG